MSDASQLPAAPPELPEPAAAEADYGLLIDALMQTQRGRWFLSEHARRCRQADQAELLEALARLERAIEREREPPVIPELGDGLAALARIEQALEQFREPRPVPEHGDSLAALARIEQALEEVRKPPAVPELGDSLAALARIEQALEQFREPRPVPEHGDSLAALARIEQALEQARAPEPPPITGVTENLAALAQAVEAVRADMAALRAPAEAAGVERARDEEMLRLLREQRERLDSLADIWARTQSAGATADAPDGASGPAAPGIGPERPSPPIDDELLLVAADERRAIHPASPAGNSAAEPPTATLLNATIFDLGFEPPPRELPPREPSAEETQDRTLAALRDALDPTFGLARALANALENGIDELIDKDERDEVNEFHANAGEAAPAGGPTGEPEPASQESPLSDGAQLPAWLVGERPPSDNGGALNLPDDVVALPADGEPAPSGGDAFAADLAYAPTPSDADFSFDETQSARATGLFDAADAIARSHVDSPADPGEADVPVIEAVEEASEPALSIDDSAAAPPTEPMQAPGELFASPAPASEPPRAVDAFFAYVAATAEPTPRIVEPAAPAFDPATDVDDIFFAPDTAEAGLIEETHEAPAFPRGADSEAPLVADDPESESASSQEQDARTLVLEDAPEREPAAAACEIDPANDADVAPAFEPLEKPSRDGSALFAEILARAAKSEPFEPPEDAPGGEPIDPLAGLSAKISAMLAAAAGPSAQQPIPDIAVAPSAATSPASGEETGCAEPDGDGDFDEAPLPRIAPPSELVLDGGGEAMAANGEPAAAPAMSAALRDILAREVRPVARSAASDPLAAVYALSEEERIALFT